MRRLRAPDKKRSWRVQRRLDGGARKRRGRGEKQQGKYSHRQRRFPATVYRGGKLPLLSVQLPLLPSTSLGPGEGFPRRRRDNAGRGAGIPLCGGDSTGEGQRDGYLEEKWGRPKNKTRVSPLKWHGDSGSCFRGLSPKWRFPSSCPLATQSV